MKLFPLLVGAGLFVLIGATVVVLLRRLGRGGPDDADNET